VSGRLLADTSVVVEFLRGNTSVAARLLQADKVYTSGIILGELYFGALISGKVAENTRTIDAFGSSTSLLPCDEDVAREYSIIRKRLRDKGKPIPENDIWIAATARQHNLTLVTRDAHFTEIDNLDLERW
jgi:tRNA(fMet)-specific endonuclease VapC